MRRRYKPEYISGKDKDNKNFRQEREEIDAAFGFALGNYPQAFTHIALINSANNLRKAEIRQAEHHTDPLIAAIRLHH